MIAKARFRNTGKIFRNRTGFKSATEMLRIDYIGKKVRVRIESPTILVKVGGSGKHNVGTPKQFFFGAAKSRRVNSWNRGMVINAMIQYRTDI